MPGISYALIWCSEPHQPGIVVQTPQSARIISSGSLSSARHRRVNPSSLRRSPVRLTQSTPASPRAPVGVDYDELNSFWEVRLHACA